MDVLIEGGITVLVGIFCLFYLDSHPKDAKWLDIKEKDILLKHIEISNTKAKDYSIKDIFKSILVWKFVFVYFCIQLSVYGVLFYLPSKIAQILQINVGFEVGLLNAIPWILFLSPCQYLPYWLIKNILGIYMRFYFYC